MLERMNLFFQTLFRRMALALRERWYRQLELIALRHQLEVLKRSAKRPRFEPADRGLWVLLSRWWPEWPQALDIVQADTVRRWRRQGLWHHLKWRQGRKRPGRPPIASETRQLIREMSRDNRLWGAPRIRGELLKLGIKVSQTTVAKYMDRRPGPPSPTWRAIWRMQAPDLVVSEVYAEVSGRLHTTYARVLGIIPALCTWLWGWVSGWWRWKLRRHVRRVPSSTAPEMASVVRALKVVEWVRAFGRSPPDYPSSSIDPPAHLYPPIEMGRADVRLDAASRNVQTPSRPPDSITRDNRTVHKSVVSEQAAA